MSGRSTLRTIIDHELHRKWRSCLRFEILAGACEYEAPFQREAPDVPAHLALSDTFWDENSLSPHELYVKMLVSSARLWGKAEENALQMETNSRRRCPLEETPRTAKNAKRRSTFLDCSFFAFSEIALLEMNERIFSKHRRQ